MHAHSTTQRQTSVQARCHRGDDDGGGSEGGRHDRRRTSAQSELLRHCLRLWPLAGMTRPPWRWHGSPLTARCERARTRRGVPSSDRIPLSFPRKRRQFLDWTYFFMLCWLRARHRRERGHFPRLRHAKARHPGHQRAGT
jgi:hypothetical protein